jgi:hypothetical protein
VAVSTRRRGPYHYGGYPQSLALLPDRCVGTVWKAERTSAAAARRPPNLASAQVGVAATLMRGQLHHLAGRQLLLGDARGVLFIVEVTEVVRLVEYLSNERPPWGPIRMEHLRVRCPCNRPGRLACCGGGACLVS